MNTFKRRQAAVAAAAAVALALLAGCTSGGGSSSSEKITLSLQTWGQFGYKDLIKKYEKEHPNITIDAQTVASSTAAQDAINTHLAAGSGMPDVAAIEIGFAANEMQYPNKWLPVPQSLADSRWLKWKTEISTDKTGKTRFYGVDAAPSAVCFDSKLLSDAGLPSDPDSFAKWIGDSWDTYFAAGKEYTAKTGKPWFDSSTWVLESKIRQIKYAFEDKNNKIIATTNPDVKAAYESSLEDYLTLSAKLSPFSADWNQAFANQQFATDLCPSWMLGVIQAAAPKVTTWNVADTFPGGGTNAGGSFLAVSTQTKHPKEAQAFAAWLTAPEQQIVAFQAVGAFPSQVEALKSKVLLDSTSTYASNAPTGKIYAHQAESITGSPYAGPNYNTIFNALQAATTRVETGQMSESDSWDKFVTDVKAINTH